MTSETGITNEKDKLSLHYIYIIRTNPRYTHEPISFLHHTQRLAKCCVARFQIHVLDSESHTGYWGCLKGYYQSTYVVV